MFERKPLKSQFIITFILIIISSIIATIASYYTGYMIYTKIEYKKMYPANYYEKKIPDIEGYIRKEGVVFLNRSEKQLIEKIIPSEGILYQVMDENGNMIYGTDYKKLLNGKEDLYNKLNTTINIDGRYVRIIPVFDSQGKISGAVSLSYTLTPHYASTSDKISLTLLFIVVVFSPFIYIVIFTLLFSKKFASNIGKPVNMLIDASRKVKEKDLDFNIYYYADNELGKLCKAFNEMKNELKESLISQWKAEQERHEMVQALAHDLKTPFSVIQGYVESLLEGNYVDTQKVKKYLQVIRDNANKGSELIKKMLYAAELETSCAKLNITPVDIYSLLMNKKESYEMMAKNKKIGFKIDVTYEKQVKMTCPVDIVKLERILDNIVSNCICYTPENGTITINANITCNNICFKVCDTGKGFSSKDLSNLFNKFYRGDESRSSKDGHAGLGLYIAKRLVEMHGGSIVAFNAKGGGACIKFDLHFLENNSNRK
ncbi:HAMP domain-containing sensor histidine kinase [Paramaledivibacter caminithermalis]|uniref:histidine kinase n=1 Tax=Paramaledivibacter caminithermalis (strain DSM 15212 / CIP 107654 / DViRD3) TaxID=1121301 RepID=A0A1M6TJG2_PARC5|nr:HAMP domain-containing sensor histidine kinase [Paramaledivibacter caminithermalis]SHK57121.1 Signal transduction histidine kinase [Paramaledivibacter caminithermalis DSM 15212]